MELANVLLALGGDRNNTVPKYDCTPAEIMVMRAIHGDDAVFDVSPTGVSVNRGSAAEKERLMSLYTSKDEAGNRVVEEVYPGRGAVLPKEIRDLDLDATLFRATARAQVPTETEVIEDVAIDSSDDETFEAPAAVEDVADVMS